MFGLLGLMGAVMAGFLVDALVSHDHPSQDDTHDAEDAPPKVEGGDEAGGSLLDDPGPDEVQDGEGADWVDAGAGADAVDGGDGDDHLQGGAGQDDLSGDEGDDQLSGGGGPDHVVGGAGDDGLTGGAGADSLAGERGDDAVQGGSGADLMIGGRGADVLDGGGGNDTVFDGAGWHADGSADVLTGGAGDDALHFGAGDRASGGAGADRFTVDDIAKGDPVAQIADFNRDEDALVVLYDASHHSDPEVTIRSDPSSPHATVMLDGVPVAHVLGGAGLQAKDVVLQAA